MADEINSDSQPEIKIDIPAEPVSAPEAASPITQDVATPEVVPEISTPATPEVFPAATEEASSEVKPEVAPEIATPFSEPTVIQPAPVAVEPSVQSPTSPPTPEPASAPEIIQAPPPAPMPASPEVSSEVKPESKAPRFSFGELIAKAQFAIQTNKNKKIERIMELFATQTNITSNDVEKLLHISGTTARQYFLLLKKQGKIQPNGKRGKENAYSKI